MVFRNIFLVIVLIVKLNYVFGQDAKTDSLINLAEAEKTDTIKANYYWKIFELNLNSNPLIAGKYILKFNQICQANLKTHHLKYFSSLLKLSSVYRTLGRFSEALPYINTAEIIADSLNNKTMLADVYLERGNFFINVGDLKKALDYFLKELNIRKFKDKYDPMLYGVYNNLGIVYAQSNNLNKAEEYFRYALSESIKQNAIQGIGNGYNNIGILRIMRGELDSALYFILKGKEYRVKLNDMGNLSGSYNNIAAYYKTIKKYPLAIRYADTSFSIASKIHLKNELIEVLQTYYEIYNEMGDYKQALKYYIDRQNILQEIQNENIDKKISEYQSGYELEKKEKELYESKSQLMLKEEKENKQKVKINLLLVILILFGTGIIIVVNRNKKIRAANAIISEQKLKVEEQKQIIEEKHKDITDSINYAQKIQNALIISESKLALHVDNVFVMFKPRDIVSGDFYWYGEKNGYKLLAVADCTGHGVPGAFMSMIGITLLNQIVNEKGITSPASILNHLREGIVSSLNPTGEVSDKRDGMDISLIAWNKEHLLFSGANNPCIAVCKGEILDLKPDKQPVGLYEKNADFTEQKLDMNQLDSIYLFTDGIVDQFGGHDGKKLKLKLFRQWLNEISMLNSHQQKSELEKRLAEWMKSSDQIDDILIIGIKA